MKTSAMRKAMMAVGVMAVSVLSLSGWMLWTARQMPCSSTDTTTMTPLSAGQLQDQNHGDAIDCLTSGSAGDMERRAALQRFTDRDHYILWDEFRQLHVCLYRHAAGGQHDPPPAVTTSETASEDILYIVMGSSVYEQSRTTMIRATWAKDILNQVVVMSDKENANATVLSMTLPENVDRVDYGHAQHRQLLFMKRIVNRTDEALRQVPSKLFQKYHRNAVMRAKWFVLVDDDTWVNTARIADELKNLPHDIPLAMGALFPLTSQDWLQNILRGRRDDPPEAIEHLVQEAARLKTTPAALHHDYNLQLGHMAGGNGMFLNAAAFDAIVQLFYTDACNFDHFNDMTMAKCLRARKIPTIHNELLRSRYDSQVGYLASSLQAMWTVHYAKPETMKVFERCIRGGSCFFE